MYTLDKHPSGAATLTVGTGPIIDLLDVIFALRQDHLRVVRVVAAGDQWKQRAEQIDKLLYQIGFDVPGAEDDEDQDVDLDPERSELSQ